MMNTQQDMLDFNLQRFLEAQDAYGSYDQAVRELEEGCKRSHWIWYVFPQLKGLGFSYNSLFYGISCRQEAEAFLANKTLEERLRTVCRLILKQAESGKGMREVLGSTDAMKVRSSLTLFDAIMPGDQYGECIDKCYGGKRDGRTLAMLADRPVQPWLTAPSNLADIL